MAKSRTTSFTLQLTRRRQLLVSIRRFYASKRRSTKYRQLVIDLDLGPIKEVALRVKTSKRPVKKIQIGPWKLQPSTPLILLCLGMIGVTYSTTHLVVAATLVPAQTFSTPVTTARLPVKLLTLAKSTPTHIAIDSVQIDADIIPVGLDASGALELPPVLSWNAGWYQNSPTPGELGPSIIVGHVDSYKSISVFWRLRYIKAGDTISITRQDGSVAKFQVTALDQYDQNSFPTAKIYGNLDYAALRVITCGGTFDTATGNYTQNTVVTAKLIAS